jgi:hypothetical protein
MVSSLVEVIRNLFKKNTYGSDLETYIVNRCPQNCGDVERYTIEYHYRKDSIL